MALLGALAIYKPNLRMHAIHIALVLMLASVGATAKALLGLLGGDLGGNAAGTYAKSTMCVLAVVYIVLGVRSFIAAKKARQNN